VREKISIDQKYGFADDSFACPTYICTNITWKKDGMIHSVQQAERTCNLDELAPQHSVPVAAFWPLLPANLTPLANRLPLDSFVKRVAYKASPLTLEAAPHIAAHTLREVELWESVLRHHPHPNVVEYRGVVSEDGEHITGIVFKRYGKLLADMKNHAEEIDVERVGTDLRRAVDHLHSLGLIHVRVSSDLRTSPLL
jgi:hypothetical protein